MRSLTEAEARVIAVLLGSSPSQERERLRRIQIPRSTYHSARRRAYEEGWLRDRYVPAPFRFGWARATFLLVRPYLDKAGELLAELKENRNTVYLWGSPQVTLAVLFHESDQSSQKFLEVLKGNGLASAVRGLTADVTGPGVPVYFDFEGLWTHLSEFEGTVSYPLGLGGESEAQHDDSVGFTAHQRWAAGELIYRPFVAADQGRPAHLIGPFGLPFSQQRLLRTGSVVHRVFLDPGRLPPFKGRQASQTIFITGNLRPSAEPPALFATMTRDCRVYPFLFALRPPRVLLGALGSSLSPNSPPTESLGARRPVLRTLEGFLEGIEIIQESTAQLTTHVDHRYDRLLPIRRARPAAGSPGGSATTIAPS
jgi:hypothetical protein